MKNVIGGLRAVGILSASLLGLGLTSAVFACPSPEALKRGALDRSFTQEKTISGVDRPLRSTGRLEARNDEVVWHMLTPFDVKTTIAPDGITQSIDGGPANKVAAGSNELSSMIARTMASMMRGDWDGLKSIFAISMPVQAGEGDWSVVLKPLDDQLGQLLGTITVRGCEEVSTVDIARPDGDREHIQFEAAAP
ncbi:MAG: outer membrane lipoprotein carrier protein LolA [Parvibaculum sp.]